MTSCMQGHYARARKAKGKLESCLPRKGSGRFGGERSETERSNTPRRTALTLPGNERISRWGKVQALQRLLTRSFSGKALAVKRVTENQGKRKPRCGPRNLGHTREENAGRP